MEIKDVQIWKPIEFSEAWERCSTSKLDVLLPSWVRRRQTLKEDFKAYNQFMERLKRQHAIETGVIERLYDLSKGITETFIKEGFVESYLQHGDTNIPPHQLMNYLNDNFSAIDFVFDVVKNNRQFTVSFIKELHQLITRHQDTAEGRDQFGNRKQIALLKGKFKEWENNPTRSDGTRFLYCPPIHVDAEMDKLVQILADLEERKVHPLLMATWLHHAFVAIHPFQDGNGRMARLLASLVLIKNELFPLTVKRGEKKRYIDNLELADSGQPQKLVDFFGELQKKNIEGVLNADIEIEFSSSSLSEVTSILAHRVQSEKSKKEVEISRRNLLEGNRNKVLTCCNDSIRDIINTLSSQVGKDIRFDVNSKWQNLREKIYYFRTEINEYAKQQGYVYNEWLPSVVVVVQLFLLNERKFRLVIPLHHFGQNESTWAIGAFLIKPIGNFFETIQYMPIQPLTISLEAEINDKELSDQIKPHLQSIFTLTLAQIASEITP